MLRKNSLTVFAIALLLSGFASSANAQVAVPIPNNTSPHSIVVSFPSNIQQVEGIAVTTSLPPAPSIYFKEAGRTVYLTATARLIADNQILLTEFKSLGGVNADLIRGSTDGAVPPLVSGKRAYAFTWTGVKLETQSQPAPVILIAEVGAATGNPPMLSTNLRLNKKEFTVASVGVSPRTLLEKFAADPSQIEVRYTFSPNDPVGAATANIVTKRAAGLKGNPSDTSPTNVIVDLGETAPRRPENYTVSIRFPAEPLRRSLEPGFTIPPPTNPDDGDFLSANRLIEVAAVDLAPPPTERAKTEFFFETTFTSIVNATTRKRGNVGLFALHLKPVVGLRFFNMDKPERRPQWLALRPLFDADVDTQPIKNSQAPNRIVFGADLEWGIDAGQQDRDDMDLVQQYVFLNGVRYDSDRDFKVQTLYWQTEFLPQFLNFEQTREQRLRQYRFPLGIRNPERARRFPLISSYHVRPSVGYQLGGTMKRGDSDSDTISRLFVKFGAGIEFKRLIQFTLDDTYYFLQDAERRRNRNYLETRLDFNTGGLFNVDLGSLQSAITLKFQRGELPPRFKAVNAFSVGFKLFR